MTSSDPPRGFPVVVVPYDPAWPGMFDAEHIALRSALTDLEPLIEHVGSTAVPGLAAKPKIDILLGLRYWEDLASVLERLLGIGYEHEPQLDIPRHLSMKRGHPTIHRVHLVELGGSGWKDALAFRDALRADADLRDRYGRLKQALALEHRDDHQAYSAGKAPFIEAVLERERGEPRPAPAIASMIQRAIPAKSATRRLRQWPTLRALVEFAAATHLFRGVLLIGSFAAGTADEVSDLDLILITHDHGFTEAWARREQLHVTGALTAWDERSDGQVGANKWVTRECILVECLIADLASGVKLAQPFVVVAGDTALPDLLEERRPILRREMKEARHPIERAYDQLKAAVRGARSTEPHS